MKEEVYLEGRLLGSPMFPFCGSYTCSCLERDFVSAVVAEAAHGRRDGEEAGLGRRSCRHAGV